MLREAHIPLFLWLPAALLFHALSGGGAYQSAKTVYERGLIKEFSQEVRRTIDDQLTEIEIDIYEKEESDTEEDDELIEPDVDEPEDEEEKAKKTPPVHVAKKVPPKVPPKKAEPPKVAKKKDEDTPKPPEAKKPPEKIAKKEKKKKKKKEKEEEKDEPQVLELPKPDGRIAVINDPSIDKNQKDNPNAHRIADHANHAKEEKMARFRSYDQNASNPTGGGHPGPQHLPQVGNAADSKRGFSNEVAGDGDPRSGSENGPSEPENEPVARSQTGSNKPVPGQQAKAAEKGKKAQKEGKGKHAPDIISGGVAAEEEWSVNPDGDGRKRQRRKKGKKGSAGQPYIPGSPGDALALYSINAFGLVDALGKQHLRKEAEKARNTRISRHRGSMKGNQFEKYRAAIENYDPSVKPGNQTSLNAARVPFASYINKMHNRIHPIFADGFLGSLRNLDADDKLSNMKLSAHLELVLDGKTGKVVTAGIVRPSGVTAFDVAALRSVYSAGPFGKAPDVIVSPDGNVYVHWEFYRDPYYACTSKFARPYILKKKKKKKKGDKPGPRKPQRNSKERTAKKDAKKSDKKAPKKKAKKKKN